jgi:hypothetical protein
LVGQSLMYLLTLLMLPKNGNNEVSSV